MANTKTDEAARRAGFKTALDAFIAKLPNKDGFGAEANLARALGVTRQAVDYWKKRGVSPAYIRRVSKLTGVPAKVIRPDIY